MIFFALPFFTTLPVTVAPATTGEPTTTPPSLETNRTWSNVTSAPASASNFSMNKTSHSDTLYCLPPVTTISYICEPPQLRLTTHKVTPRVNVQNPGYVVTARARTLRGQHNTLTKLY